jgi:hypothetical protein
LERIVSDRYERLAFAVANYLTAHDALVQGAWDDDSGAINWWTEEMREIIEGEDDAEG